MKNYLGSSIARTSTGCFELFALFVKIPKPKVYQFEVEVRVYQYVTWLDVTMSAAYRMQILDRADELLKEFARLFFTQLVFIFDVCAQFTLLSILHNEEEVLIGLDDLV